MMRKRAVFWTVAGACLILIAALALLAALARHRPGSEKVRTEWEGEWEVPIVEGNEQSETFVLAENKRFHLRVIENVHDFYAGNELTVRWEPGKVFVNDILVFPEPVERKILSAAEVIRQYGEIPTVRDYITAHRGEASEDTVATKAMEAWLAKKQEVLREVWERYLALVKTLPPREAAEAVGEVVRASGLADSVSVNIQDYPPESKVQSLQVGWHGFRWAEGVSLLPWRSELPPPTVTAKRLYIGLTGMLKHLTYGDNSLTVRLEGGSTFLEGDLLSRPEGGEQ